MNEILLPDEIMGNLRELPTFETLYNKYIRFFDDENHFISEVDNLRMDFEKNLVFTIGEYVYLSNSIIKRSEQKTEAPLSQLIENYLTTLNESDCHKEWTKYDRYLLSTLKEVMEEDLHVAFGEERIRLNEKAVINQLLTILNSNYRYIHSTTYGPFDVIILGSVEPVCDKSGKMIILSDERIHSLNAYYPRVLHYDGSTVALRKKALENILQVKYINGYKFSLGSESSFIRFFINRYYDDGIDSPEFYQHFYNDNINNLILFGEAILEKQGDPIKTTLSKILFNQKEGFEIIQILDFTVMTTIQIAKILEDPTLSDQVKKRRLFLLMAESNFEKGHYFHFLLAGVMHLFASICQTGEADLQKLELLNKQMADYSRLFFDRLLDDVFRLIEPDYKSALMSNTLLIDLTADYKQPSSNDTSRIMYRAVSQLDTERKTLLAGLLSERHSEYLHQISLLISAPGRFSQSGTFDYHGYAIAVMGGYA